ncbi:AAA family ATPase [Streptosporangium sp. NPDC006930]|uniref:AAA family ATPase n=1 Tax=Streptosporangium sp. NPDC006930 TaxID=3154783 RepID=UPI003423FEA5
MEAAEPDGDPPLTGFSDAQRLQALERWRLLRPHLQDDVPLARIAASCGVPKRTLRRWRAAYQASGLAALVRRSRSDRGRARMPEPLRLLIEGLALRPPRQSVAVIHRQAASVATAQGWPVPAYSTVHEIVRNLDPALVALGVEGSKPYREVYELVHRREASQPNQVWQADHTELDLWVLDPKGQPARPWLTTIEDDHSHAIAGYAVNLEAPSALSTALAFRQAIWRKAEPGWHVCGIPEIFRLDHGPDFTSAHLEQVMADLRVRPVFSKKGQPHGHGKIERFMETMNQMCLAHLPGYAPKGSTGRAAQAPLTPPSADDSTARAYTTDRPPPASEPGPAPANRSEPAPAPLLVTKEHRRFGEFAEAVRRKRYIGLCYGGPGVDKTESARAYTRWDQLAPHFNGQGSAAAPEADNVLAGRAVMYTPKVHSTPDKLDKEISLLCDRPGRTVDLMLQTGRGNGDNSSPQTSSTGAELLIVDEADRLKTAGLEQLRDHHDRTGIGVILIGMPGIEKRLARYPQLYSRVGFIHHYKPLSADEQAHVLDRKWPHLGLGASDDFATTEAIAAITRITSGNFRLITRLVDQIERVLEINQLSTVTKEVVEAARENLIIGVM